MLDSSGTQGAGLQQFGLQTAPRVIAMASHGDQQGELPLLWNLCSTLVEMGHSTVVLDANTEETPDNPGLNQLLDGSFHPRDGLSEFDSWSVIPAAHGLSKIGSRNLVSKQFLEPLNTLLENFGVILVYAPTEALVKLLSGTSIEPLLTVSPLKISSVTAYQSLKLMLLSAGLKPTVAHIAINSLAGLDSMNKTAAQNLQECSLNFLGCRVDPLTIRVGEAKERIADDMRRLTSRLLEKALPLPRYPLGGVL